MVPLVVIVGATGVGKSRLGISLAQTLHKPPGQVISADSMQVYKGLDIASAKVTEAEAQGVIHHLISFVDLNQVFQVHNFLDAALPQIAAIHANGDLPLVVGGTFFYVEALLWDNFLAQPESKVSIKPTTKRPAEGSPFDCEGEDDVKELQETTTTINSASTPLSASISRSFSSPPRKKSSASTSINSPNQSPSQFASSIQAWEELQEVDPLMARRLHPHDIRKIRRSLEVFHTTGKRHSEWLEETGGALGPKAQLRYNCVILWLDCEQTVLDQRLDKRVDEMLERGLVKEVEEYYLQWKQSRIVSSSTSSFPPSSSSSSSASSSASSCLFPSSSSTPSICVSSDSLPVCPPSPPLSFSASAICPLSPSPSSSSLRSSPTSLPSSICPHTPPSSSSSSLPSSICPPSPSLSSSASFWVDGPTGVCQAIGYKEFLPYLKLKFDQQGDEKEVAKCLADCVDTLKHATRRYSRNQRRWIIKRFEGRGLTVHRLDTTDVNTWQQSVFEPSLAACNALKSAQTAPPLVLPTRPEPTISEWQKYTCEECAKTLNGTHEWKVHITSKKHKKRVASAPLRRLVAELNRKTQTQAGASQSTS